MSFVESDRLRTLSVSMIEYRKSKTKITSSDDSETESKMRLAGARKSLLHREKIVNIMDYLSTLAPRVRHLKRHRQAKIMCTIGPSTRSPDVIEKMIESGMNVARILMGSGEYDFHRETIRFIRKAIASYSKKIGRQYPVGIALDLKGSEIRTGYLKAGVVQELLEKGKPVIVTTDVKYRKSCNANYIWVDYKDLAKTIRVGKEIYLNYGYVCLTVKKIESDMVHCVVKHGGKLESKSKVDLPGTDVKTPSLTERDKRDVAFAKEERVDIIFVSYAKNAHQIRKLRAHLGEAGKSITVIAKIESKTGVVNCHSLLYEADGIYIGRLNLGINITSENLIVVQKSISAVCRKVGKLFLVGSHFLSSMRRLLVPSFNEVFDIANAIADGADCLVLFHETTIGDHPLECISTMARIAKEAEAVVWRSNVFRELCYEALPPMECAEAIAMAAVEMSMRIRAKAILIVTRSGRSAKLVAKYLPDCPIIVIIGDRIKAIRLLLLKGVQPVIFEEGRMSTWIKDVERRVQYGIEVGLREGLVKKGEAIVVMTGSKWGQGFTNALRLVYIPFTPKPVLY